jgi:GTP-sensing pleiotropic transcriptional regulator CodY
MRRNIDKPSENIIELLDKSEEPLETKEIEDSMKKITRSKLFYRLTNLRGEGIIKGKIVGSGKGTWIWWKNG